MQVHKVILTQSKDKTLNIIDKEETNREEGRR